MPATIIVGFRMELQSMSADIQTPMRLVGMRMTRIPRTTPRIERDLMVSLSLCHQQENAQDQQWDPESQLCPRAPEALHGHLSCRSRGSASATVGGAVGELRDDDDDKRQDYEDHRYDLEHCLTPFPSSLCTITPSWTRPDLGD